MKICNSFNDFNIDFLSTLGFLSEIMGQRPSDLIGWKDEEDFFERVMFDIKCINIMQEDKEREYRKQERKMR